MSVVTLLVAAMAVDTWASVWDEPEASFAPQSSDAYQESVLIAALPGWAVGAALCLVALLLLSRATARSRTRKTVYSNIDTLVARACTAGLLLLILIASIVTAVALARSTAAVRAHLHGMSTCPSRLPAPAR